MLALTKILNLYQVLSCIITISWNLRTQLRTQNTPRFLALLN